LEEDMKDDGLMSRLRTARPLAAEPGGHDALFARIVAEPGDPRVVGAPHRRSSGLRAAKTRLGRRPRVLAGGTLGLAGVGAALVLVLGGTAATTPAFAITRSNDGSVLVHLNYTSNQDLPQLNAKLASMGIHEQVGIQMAPGAATVSGPIICSPTGGVSGPTVKVLVGANGTEAIGPGQSGGNTAEGSFHLARCFTSSDTASGNSGNG
jgi:hypothetical protein